MILTEGILGKRFPNSIRINCLPTILPKSLHKKTKEVKIRISLRFVKLLFSLFVWLLSVAASTIFLFLWITAAAVQTIVFDLDIYLYKWKRGERPMMKIIAYFRCLYNNNKISLNRTY